MTKVILKRWDGGQAQSERPETTNENGHPDFGYTGGFDIFQDPFKLTKLTSPTVNETASGASVVSGECPVMDAVKRDSDGLIVGIGATSLSGSLLSRFYRKSSSITGTWQQNSATGIGIANGGGAHCLLFKGYIYAFVTNVASTVSRLYLYTDDSTMTLVGSVSDYGQNYLCPKPIVHSQDKCMYMAAGKTIAKFDGATSTTTFTASVFTTPFEITSICEYGTYLAVLMQTPDGGVIGLWGRDTTLTTFQDIIKVDNGYAPILENLDGYLVSVSQTPYDPYPNSIPTVYSNGKFINVRMYLGGTMKLVKRAPIGLNENNSSQGLLNRKMVRDGRLFFSTNSNFLWSFGQNRDGQYVLSRDYQVAYTNRTVVTINSFFSLGEYLFCCQRTTTGSPSDGLLQRTDGTFGSDTSYYTTTINPSMPLDDRMKLKKLSRIYVKAYCTSSSGATLSVLYKFDGASVFTTAIAETSITQGYKIYECGTNSDLSEFGDGRDLVIQIQATKQVDIIEVGYEYDVEPTLIS